MTLLELAPNQDATITDMCVDHVAEERLYALGICIGSTISKVNDSAARPSQPVCVSTHSRSMFAISRILAAQITIRIAEDML